MTRDVEILAKAEAGSIGCRVYGWDGPWVSLGKYQSPERDLVSEQVPHVIRPTGDKAVLHGHDVTVGLAAPLEAWANNPAELQALRRSIKSVYTCVATPIIEALRACGVPAVLASGTRHDGAGSRTVDCFAFVSGNDIVHETTGLKVCGCALKLTHDAVLVQASIPKGESLVDPASCIRNASALTLPEWDDAMFAPTLERELQRLAERSLSVVNGLR